MRINGQAKQSAPQRQRGLGQGCGSVNWVSHNPYGSFTFYYTESPTDSIGAHSYLSITVSWFTIRWYCASSATKQSYIWFAFSSYHDGSFYWMYTKLYLQLNWITKKRSLFTILCIPLWVMCYMSVMCVCCVSNVWCCDVCSVVYSLCIWHTCVVRYNTIYIYHRIYTAPPQTEYGTIQSHQRNNTVLRHRKIWTLQFRSRIAVSPRGWPPTESGSARTVIGFAVVQHN